MVKLEQELLQRVAHHANVRLVVLVVIQDVIAHAQLHVIAVGVLHP